MHDKCTPDEPAFLSLQRVDGIPEAFLVVWKFAALRLLGDAAGASTRDLTLCRDRGAYACKSSEGRPGQVWCVPGQSVQSLSVLEYKQFGTWAEKKS